MIEKNEFPYTLGGYVEQCSYKGFDIAVSIRRYKGISAYVISSEKRLIREESATFADKEDMFRWGREAVDRYLEQQERRKEENAVKRAGYYKKKAREAALKAFNTAMYFSDIKNELYDKAKGFFEYEEKNIVYTSDDGNDSIDVSRIGICSHSRQIIYAGNIYR